ncbi:heavy metal sensor signal transduction histidine kinase [Methylovorus sp. MP688]|nr:heavy metal sensor signal transduction histidine kinase [Methylovorus sp. MP688]
MNMHTSIITRITLIFAALSTVVMIAIGAIASYAVDSHFAEEDLIEIEGKLELIHHALNSAPEKEEQPLPQRLNDALIGHHALSVMVYRPDKQLVYRSMEASFPPELLLPHPAPYAPHSAHLQRWQQNGHAYRGLVVQFPASAQRPFWNVAIAVDIGHHDHFIHHFQRSLWLYLTTGILFLVAVGWIAARRGLRPIRDFARMAGNISASRLGERIDVASLPRELVELGVSFNDMLQRLQESFLRLSEFSSDIAHELRTPVSNLMTQSHVALSQARSTGEYQEILYSNIEEYERLSRMIADMLFLAKADNGLLVPHRETMDLGVEIDAVIEFYEALAAEKQLLVSRHGTATLAGDRLMIRRAFSNLLSNAVRYTPVGQTITITLHYDDSHWITVWVDNAGEPVPEDALARLFDRFYRVDPSRQRESEGTGLGLAITKSIIEAHGGSIRALYQDHTMRFELRLPRAEISQFT